MATLEKRKKILFLSKNLDIKRDFLPLVTKNLSSINILCIKREIFCINLIGDLKEPKKSHIINDCIFTVQFNRVLLYFFVTRIIMPRYLSTIFMTQFYFNFPNKYKI